MSQEQPPIRSRRELRQARDERREPGAPASGAVPPASNSPASANKDAANKDAANKDAARPDAVDPGEPTEAETTGRRRIPGPVDSVSSSPGTERSSQIRARDRATLRTIKELAEKEGNLAAGGPPTRRQLRLLQLAAETAPATSANLIVPASPRTRVSPSAPPPGAEADAPAAGAETAAPADEEAVAGPGAPGAVGMSVEQALAARELLAQQAQNQLAKMEHINAVDADAVDPRALAEQIAVAERAAVLGRRAAAKQKLAEQNSVPEPVRNDPTTANNLAMVTPLEFVQVPGVERPVLKRPATSHVPVVTNPGPRVGENRKSGGHRPGASRQRKPGPATGRSGVLARAEAAARASSVPPAESQPAAGEPPTLRSEEDFAGGSPVAASAAYGLEPLDAVTAGLGRARRLRLVVLALGVLALIAGITLIVTAISG
ncbi:hypothetical protein [Pseudarthrobacter sp. PH31-O2]|uniref:hypothetical protein n=1 Tax=Pseudarthrobacter sp. PH31-O2 TaxID=3046206 RepID=UPI0024BBE30F|nr:hypothetical protein [Pseudarthrobacter sp. PH31-O2]MDJ0351485.1 hypothetical protein [Pseudarthrobacter sp. PH31-O2]